MFFEKYVKKYTHCAVFWTVSIFFTLIWLNFIRKVLNIIVLRSIILLEQTFVIKGGGACGTEIFN